MQPPPPVYPDPTVTQRVVSRRTWHPVRPARQHFPIRMLIRVAAVDANFRIVNRLNPGAATLNTQAPTALDPAKFVDRDGAGELQRVRRAAHGRCARRVRPVQPGHRRPEPRPVRWRPRQRRQAPRWPLPGLTTGQTRKLVEPRRGSSRAIVGRGIAAHGGVRKDSPLSPTMTRVAAAVPPCSRSPRSAARPAPTHAAGIARFGIARLKYGGGGDWYGNQTCSENHGGPAAKARPSRGRRDAAWSSSGSSALPVPVRTRLVTGT